MQAHAKPLPKYVSPKGMWTSKLVLRATSVVFTIIVAALGGSIASNPKLDEYDVMLIIMLPGIIPTFIWDIAEGICIIVRGGHRGAHPGAVVGLDLVIWLGWIVVIFFLFDSGLIDDPGYFIAGYSSYNAAGISNSDLQLADEIAGKGRGMAAVSSLVLATHFALFVIGCYETHIRNRLTRTVYITDPAYGQLQGAPGQHQNPGTAQLPQDGKTLPQTQMFTQPQQVTPSPQYTQAAGVPPQHAHELPPHIMTPPPTELPLQPPQGYPQHAHELPPRFMSPPSTVLPLQHPQAPYPHQVHELPPRFMSPPATELPLQPSQAYYPQHTHELPPHFMQPPPTELPMPSTQPYRAEMGSGTPQGFR